MSMFTLAISCLTTSNLPWSMDLTIQVPIQYCSLQHRTLLSPADTSRTECHFCFGPAASFFLVLAISNCPLLFPHRVLNTFRPRGFIFQCHIFLPLHTVHGVLKAKMLKWLEVVTLLQWITFCQHSPPWPVHLGWPYKAWITVSLSYTRLWPMRGEISK